MRTVEIPPSQPWGRPHFSQSPKGGRPWSSIHRCSPVAGETNAWSVCMPRRSHASHLRGPDSSNNASSFLTRPFMRLAPPPAWRPRSLALAASRPWLPTPGASGLDRRAVDAAHLDAAYANALAGTGGAERPRFLAFLALEVF